MSIGEEEEDRPMFASLTISTIGGPFVNRRSWSIEKRQGKKKVVYKSKVVM